MRFEGKLMTGSMIIEKATSFCVEMKIIDHCIFSGGWLRNLKEPAAEGDIQMEYSFD
jgi:hypothetical protein